MSSRASGLQVVGSRETLLKRMSGDEDLLRSLVETFLEECPSQMEVLRKAVEEENPCMLEETAHALKGVVGNLEGEEARKVAARLEEIGRTGNLKEAQPALRRLEMVISRLTDRLDGLRDEKSVSEKSGE